jgi:uncharacterized protein (UPF0303 family)
MHDSFDWGRTVRAAVVGVTAGVIIWLALIGAVVVYLALGGR